MKIREFRYGNIVMVDNPKYHPQLKNVPLRVIGVEETIFDGKKDFSIRLEDVRNRETYAQLIRFIKPVELTEELFIKLGFELKGYAYDFDNENYEISVSLYLGKWQFYFRKKSKKVTMQYESYVADKKYLHEYQNLYYVITDEELEVKL